ncbi:MAG: cupin domain-containing protein [Polyangiaceae bacterium]|nr:cupin domain-containing protein [Myxococcales bacterium]MCB9586198.1 cupin domain-containing protein [Polyangiaceae bacterium]MCB9606875.1 cupin domain-containing protein [Polyangiaceae bacterium]
MKPVINLDEVELEAVEPTGDFAQSYGLVSERIGAKKLGYNLTVVPPGKRACPFHNHHVNEEMFLILEGEGTLRFGDQEYPLKAHDIIACPPGKRDVAHQIINSGSAPLRYLSLSTMDRTEVCEYPDSDKVGVFVGEWGNMALRKLFKASQDVDYNDGEV